MKKFNWKSKKFLALVFTAVLMGVGYSNPVLVNTSVEIVCNKIGCEA